MSLDPMQFRNTLAQWASGVTVVTATHEGRLYGMTASSFSSVSLDPPLILICVGKQAYSHRILREAGAFGVNILSASQAELGKRFAQKTVEYVDRFVGIDYKTAQTGAPLLAGTVAWLDCRTHQTVDAGDHTIFIGEVLETQINGAAPLVYVNRQWGSFTAE